MVSGVIEIDKIISIGRPLCTLHGEDCPLWSGYGSMMITSNLPFSQWEQIFKDPITTAAAIDRLVHHSVILEMNVPSYRLEQAKARKRPKQDEKGGG